MFSFGLLVLLPIDHSELSKQFFQGFYAAWFGQFSLSRFFFRFCLTDGKKLSLLTTKKKNKMLNQNNNFEPKSLFFVSDLHFSHDREFIWGKRGYNSGQEHDNGLIENWNNVCDENSVVFHLGDICFNDPDGKKTEYLFRRLKFKKLYCLLGNHNSGQSNVYRRVLGEQFENAFPPKQGNPFDVDLNSKNHYEVYPLWYEINSEKKVCFLPEYFEIRVGQQKIVLCHFPIVSHHKNGHGSWMVCGHSHGSCEFSQKNANKGKILDVGIESFGRPISFFELKTIMDKKDIVSYDHHSSKTT